VNVDDCVRVTVPESVTDADRSPWVTVGVDETVVVTVCPAVKDSPLPETVPVAEEDGRVAVPLIESEDVKVLDELAVTVGVPNVPLSDEKSVKLGVFLV
jgi:hypothetical protein